MRAGAALVLLAAIGGPGSAAQAEEIEVVEVVEIVEEVQPATPAASGSEQELSVLEIFGRLHPALTHLPIGWLLALLLVDAGAWLLRRSSWEEWGRYLLYGTVLCFVPAIISGLLRADALPQQGEIAGLLATHRTLIFVMAGLTLTALVLRTISRNRLQGAIKLAYLGLIGAACLLIAVAGHYGGMMVYGTSYLPF